MSGFQPDPATLPSGAARVVPDPLVSDATGATVRRFKHVLQRIADGEARDPRVEAKVALGILPIGALLTPPDPEQWCVKCNNKGRTTKGPGNQQFGCPGCGYLVGEHPKYPATRGAT